MSNILNPPLSLVGYVSASYDPGNNTSDIILGDTGNYLTYQWIVNITVNTPQSHGSPNTRIPNAYTCVDVEIGDWICTSESGAALQIISIDPSTTDSSLVCTVQDMDFFNTTINSQNSGGLTTSSNCVIFSLNDNGLPVILGIPDYVMPLNFQTDLISRFYVRNNISQYVSVIQVGHTFVPNDILYIDNTGTYNLLQANSINVKNIIGIVQDIGIPTPDNFTYKPLYPLTTGLSLPGTAGSLIYISPTVPGTLTAVQPGSWAVPLYLQIDSAGTTGLLINRGIDIVGPTGKASSGSITVVADMTALNAITDLTPGNQAFVTDTGNGQWGMFIYDNAWTLISSQALASTDSKSSTITIDHTMTSPLTIDTVNANVRVSDITVNVTDAFNALSTITIGDDTINNRLMDSTEIDPSTIGVYASNTSYQYAAQTQLKVYFNLFNSPTGSATITISYS